MFNSSKSPESSRNFKNNSPYDETLYDTKFYVLPKMTSTPRNSIFATPPKSHILTPRRYSLSSEIATPPRGSRKEYFRLNSSQNLPGPLLASTKYNINVSTYEDVKSPGLTSRIVQYNEESEKEQKRHVTHQSKYDSVGLFPVVHLFKKKLPLLEQKPKHVTVRVASPDYIKHTPEYNKKLMEGIVKPSNHNPGGHNNSSFSENSNTRSVLDALKEISRKRIHANEELELLGDAGKKLRTENEECPDSNKRLRDDDSPCQETTSPSRPALKKICVYNEYAASLSSTDFLKKTDIEGSKRKSISTSTSTENPKDSKQIKLINAETQTLPEENLKKKDSKEDSNKEDIQNETPKKGETVLKVFDDAPLERIRKNRLAALIGALIGKDPVLEPKPDYATLLQDESDNTKNQEEPAEEPNKPSRSILITSNKSRNKSDKHIHFNIPESSTESSSISVPTSTENSTSENADNKVNKHMDELSSSLPISTVKSSNSTPSFSFDSSSTNTLSTSTTLTTSIATTKFVSLFPNKPAIEVTSNLTNVSKIPVITTSVNTSSPPKVGGFKFDLDKPAVTVSTPTSKLDFSFGVPTTTSNMLGGTTPSGSFVTPIINKTISPNNKNEKSLELFTKVSSPFTSKIGEASEITSKPSFSFGPDSTTPITAFSLEAAKSVSTTNSSNFPIHFGATSSMNNGFSTVTSPRTSFSTFTSVANKGLITSPSATSNPGGSSASVVPTFSVTVPSVNSTLNNSPFGNVNTTNAAIFGNTTKTTSGFGVSPAFVNSTVSTAAGFGAPTSAVNNSFGATTTSNGFGTSASSSAFGTSTASGGFGTSSTSTGFGLSTTSGGFGTSSTTITGGFGASTTSIAGGFGAPITSGFGTFATAANNIFGASMTSGNTGFVNVAKTMTSPSFATQPASNNGFGTPTTAISGFTTSTTSVGGFGGGNFGTVANSASFGTPTTSAFSYGGVITTSATNFGPVRGGFGANGASLFTNTNVPTFGNSTNTSSFGSNTTSFTEAPFGVRTTNSSVFGTTPTTTISSFTNEVNNKLFGSGGANFGAPTTRSSLFGNTPSTFNATSTTTASSVHTYAFTGKTTANNTFAANNTMTPSIGISFGQTNTGFGNQPASNFVTSNKPIFGNTNSPAFGGSTNTAVFGATQQQQQPPPFDTSGSVFTKPPTSAQNVFGSSQFTFNQPQNNANSFGSSTNQPGVFTFGSGPSEKPASFNFRGASSTDTSKKFDFTGGSTAPPAFGASFGNSAPATAPNFTAPVAGGFSIGSGPPASNRPRPIIKGKRRT